MVDAAFLSKITVAAFIGEAIRNVILIDEQFPNLHETLNAIEQKKVDELAEKYRELVVAQKLYHGLHSQCLLCDVANSPDEWTDKLSSRISESDLVILDLHLQDNSDSTDSINVLRLLANSRKFNLVLVYTRDTNLSSAAYRIAGSLRGKSASDSDADFEAELPEVVSHLSEYDCPDDEIVHAFLQNREPRVDVFRPFLGMVMQKHPALRAHKDLLVPSLAGVFLERDYGAVPTEEQRPLAAAALKATNPWMVFENLFVVVANKQDTPPSAVIPVLEKAIVEWNPGIVRALVAQIQNTMSRRGYAFGDSLSSDLQTQIGWLWHATSLGGHENTNDAVRPLLNRMLLGLRKNLFSDDTLSDFAEKCLSEIPTHNEIDKQIEEAKDWCGQSVREDVDPNSVLHALNAYQSSSPFEGEYITTGTIMVSDDKGEKRWWVCVEPACDMVPNQAPTGSAYIQCQLLELKKKTKCANEILSNASQSKHLFVVYDGQREYLSVVNENDQPLLRVAYARKESQLEPSDQYSETDIFFPSLEKADPKWIRRRMRIVAQLHEPYANRLLHLAGHHLSRIGLDFVDRPKKTNAKAIEAKQENDVQGD